MPYPVTQECHWCQPVMNVRRGCVAVGWTNVDIDTVQQVGLGFQPAIKEAWQQGKATWFQGREDPPIHILNLKKCIVFNLK